MHLKQVLAVLIGFLSVAVASNGDEVSQESLRGLKGIAVYVAPVTSDMEKAGLHTDKFQTDVELKLRLAGITVYPMGQSPATLWVHLNTATANEAGVWAYSVGVDVRQRAVLSRADITIPLATTWSVANVAIGPPGDMGIRNTVKDLIDVFIDQYFAVNPKE